MKMTLLASAAALLVMSATSFAASTTKDPGFTVKSELSSGSVVERRKPRVRGGSGCDDPRDLIEHPECR